MCRSNKGEREIEMHVPAASQPSRDPSANARVGDGPAGSPVSQQSAFHLCAPARVRVIRTGKLGDLAPGHRDDTEKAVICTVRAGIAKTLRDTGGTGLF